MTTRMYVREVKRFLKENVKLILLFSIVGSGLFLGFLNLSLGSKLDAESPDVIGEKINDVSVRYAQFVVYAEKSDDTPFTNNALIEKLLLTPSHVKNVENLVGIDIQSLLNEQIKQEFSATPTNRGVIGIEIDPVTDSLKFVSKVGTEEQRLQTVEYFFKLIQNDEIEFLVDKQLTVIEVPNIHEYTPDELLKAEQALASLSSENNSQVMFIIEIILSLIVGLLIGLIMTFFYHVFTSKINYAFNYYVSKDDLLVIAHDNKQDLFYAVVEPVTEKKLLASQTLIPEYLSKKLGVVATTTQNLLEISPEEEFVETIIIVLEGETDKEWYSQQINFARRFQTHVKVIQTSSDIFNSDSE